jgi:hypothetical protein
MEYTIQDTFYITGRGFIFTLNLPLDSSDVLRFDDEISILEPYNGIEEKYTIIGIERFNHSFGPSNNIGILIRGDLRESKNSYCGKKFVKVIP